MYDTNDIDREARLRAAQELRESGEEYAAAYITLQADPTELWRAVLQRFGPEITPAELDVYFTPTAGARLDDHLLTVNVPSEDVKDWLLHRFGNRLRSTLEDLGVPEVNILFNIVTPTMPSLIKSDDGAPLPRIHVERALSRWKTELLDLSRNNQLLYGRPGRSMMALSQPDPVELFDTLVNRSKGYTIYRPDLPTSDRSENVEGIDLQLGQTAPVCVLRSTSGERSERIMRPPRRDEVIIVGDIKKTENALYRFRLKARTALQEQGTNVLYLAFGTLDWTEQRASESRVLSPLLLAPARLEQATALSPYTITPLDEEPVLNPALARKLEVEYGLQLRLPALDDRSDLDLQSVLKLVRAAVDEHRGWEVRAETYLGLFSFAKQALYTDLEQHHDLFAQHPVLRSISGEVIGVPDVPAHTPTAEELDRDRAPKDAFQVVDADASQQEAIAAVLTGTNIVIQGPPGTGKSQTITNIIAEALAAGKTVLFVSEKMAALRVVAKRLAEAGLNEFCLEAHSQDLRKDVVVHELARVLNEGRGKSGVRESTRVRVDLERLGQVREALNRYVDVLHDTNTPLGLSAYDVHGEFARNTAPVLPFTIDGLDTMTPADLSRLQGVVQRLVGVGDTLLAGPAHPWYGCTVAIYTPQVHARLSEGLERMLEHAPALQALGVDLRTHLGLDGGDSLGHALWLEELLGLVDNRVSVPREWLEAQSVEQHVTAAETYRATMRDYRTRRASILSRYTDTLFTLDLPAVVDGLSDHRAATWVPVRGDGSPMDRAVKVEVAASPWGDAVATGAETVIAIGMAIGELLGIPAPSTIEETRRLTTIARLVGSDLRPTALWFEPGRLADMRELAREARTHSDTIHALSTDLGARFKPDLYDIATATVLDELDTAYSSWLRILKPGYRHLADRVRRLQLKAGDLSFDGLREALRSAHSVTAARTWFSAHRDELVRSFGSHYRALETDWDTVDAALATLEQIVDLLGGRPVPGATQALLLGDPDGPRKALTSFRTLSTALDTLDNALDHLDAAIDLQSLLQSPQGREQHPLHEMGTSVAAWLDAVRPLWTSVAAMRAVSIGTPVNVESMENDVREALALHAIERELLDAADRLHGEFGHLYRGLQTDWETVLDRLGWTGALLRHFDGPPPTAFTDRLLSDSLPPQELRQAFTLHLSGMQQVVAELRADFTPESYVPDGAGTTVPSLLNDARWAETKRATLVRLEEWCDLSHALGDAQALGLGGFVEALTAKRLPVTIWFDAFMRQLYTQWLTWRYATSEPLAQFRGRHHEELIAEFRRLDTWQMTAARERIAQRLRARRPALGISLPPKSEPAILLREASKRRRFRPLRKLFADLPNLLLALKPCLLMSPLAVAQFLGESPLVFDLVVFDEASQILPADAVGAIGRGRQVVVVGDEKQLPPTRFFSVDIQQGDDEEEEELPESILDTCRGIGMPRKSLLWHYRSRHEDLIAFSNQHFYERALVTFPSPDAHRRAVEFVHVPEGEYRRSGGRVNRIEAERLVDRVITQLRAEPRHSVGVITFSEAQMVQIQQVIDERKRRDPSLEPFFRDDVADGFFVKNLENVQGDERDVIFFSVGYGPDADGKLSMNFGPLNRIGGERRLNVAVTRARYRVIILASFRPEALDLARTKARGVHLLRRYLEFAEHGPDILTADAAGQHVYPSAFEKVAAHALERQNIEIVPQIGVGGSRVDLGVRTVDDDRYILGIESDGETYRSAKTARDRDRLREQVLRALGWSIERVWSTEWVKDPQREVDRIHASLDEIVHGPDNDTPQDEPSVDDPGDGAVDSAAAEVTPDVSETADPVAPPVEEDAVFGQTYRYASLPSRKHAPETLPSARAPYLAGLVTQVVVEESPVHIERVIRALADVYCVDRVTKRTRPHFLRAIAAALETERVAQRGDFLWSPSMTQPPVRASDETGKVRRIAEIAQEELREALCLALRNAFSMAQSDLIITAARGLGYVRTGTLVSSALIDALETLIDDGTVVSTGDLVRLVVTPTV